MPVRLWICSQCGTAHQVSPIQVGKRATCRSCKQASIVADHTDDVAAQTKGVELRKKKRTEGRAGRRGDPSQN